MRTAYRILSLLSLFRAASNGGVTGLAKNRVRAYAHRGLERLLRKWLG